MQLSSSCRYPQPHTLSGYPRNCLSLTTREVHRPHFPTILRHRVRQVTIYRSRLLRCVLYSDGLRLLKPSSLSEATESSLMSSSPVCRQREQTDGCHANRLRKHGPVQTVGDIGRTVGRHAPASRADAHRGVRDVDANPGGASISSQTQYTNSRCQSMWPASYSEIGQSEGTTVDTIHG